MGPPSATTPPFPRRRSECIPRRFPFERADELQVSAGSRARSASPFFFFLSLSQSAGGHLRDLPPPSAGVGAIARANDAGEARGHHRNPSFFFFFFSLQASASGKPPALFPLPPLLLMTHHGGHDRRAAADGSLVPLARSCAALLSLFFLPLMKLFTKPVIPPFSSFFFLRRGAPA